MVTERQPSSGGGTTTTTTAPQVRDYLNSITNSTDYLAFFNLVCDRGHQIGITKQQLLDNIADQNWSSDRPSR